MFCADKLAFPLRCLRTFFAVGTLPQDFCCLYNISEKSLFLETMGLRDVPMSTEELFVLCS